MPSKRNNGCVRADSSYSAKARARIDAGLCNKCSAPRGEDGTATLCRACAKDLVEYNLELRRKRYNARLCIACGNERNNKGKRCVTCAAKSSASANAYYRKRLTR